MTQKEGLRASMSNPNPESLFQKLLSVKVLLPLLVIWVAPIVYGYQGLRSEPQNVNAAYDRIMEVNADWSEHERELSQKDKLKVIMERSYNRQVSLTERFKQVTPSTDRHLFLKNWEDTLQSYREDIGWDTGTLEQFDESYPFLHGEAAAVYRLLLVEKEASITLTRFVRVYTDDSSTQAEKGKSRKAILSLVPKSQEAYAGLMASHRRNIDRLDSVAATNLGDIGDKA